MAKLIKKKDCKFESQHIICKNKVVGLPMVVWYQLNQLEVVGQQYMYLREQPGYQPGPTLEGFNRRSIIKENLPYCEPDETPVSDRRYKEAMQFIEEQEKIEQSQEINEAIKRYSDLIQWLNEKKFIAGDCYKAIDTPFLGNPLELAVEDVCKLLTEIVVNPVKMAE